MVHGSPGKLPTQGAGVDRRDARDQNRLAFAVQLGGDGRHLGRGFARAEDHLGKTLAQGPMCIDHGELEIGQRRGLERAEDLVTFDAAGAVLFEEFSGLSACHRARP